MLLTMLVRCLLVLLCYLCCALGRPNDHAANKLVAEGDYYINYEYDANASDDNIRNKALDSSSNYSSSTTSYLNSDSLILPNPDTLDSKYTVDVLPNIELPDDSLADSDLKDHDLIDSIMYVYYGPRKKNGKHYVSGVLITSSVLGCAIQSCTLFSVLVNKYYKGRRTMMLFITSNILGSLFLSNVIFMLSLYITKESSECLAIALLLNFLNIHTASSICMYCFYIQRTFCGKRTKGWHFNTVTFAWSLTQAVVTDFIIPDSYETKHYCFASMYKGMIVNTIIPISISLGLTKFFTFQCLLYGYENYAIYKRDCLTESLRAIKHEVEKNDKENDCNNIPEREKIDSLIIEVMSCLAALWLLQIAFYNFWFFTALTLENGQKVRATYFQLFVSAVLNLFIFFKSKTFLPAIEYTSPPEKIICDQPDEDTLSAITNLDVPSAASSDNIPLSNSDNATEMKELGGDLTQIANEPSNISTISS